MMKTANASLAQNMKMKSLVTAILLSALCLLTPLSRGFAATHTWTGAGANKYWNNAANWSGGAPTAGEAAPVVLIFPGSVVTTNNIPGLTVDSLRFTGGLTVLHGSSGGTLTFRNSADGRDDEQLSYAYARAYINDAAWVATARDADR